MHKDALDWLNTLNSDTTGEGAIYLANLYLSWEEEILPPDVIRGFLADCHNAQQADSSKNAVLIYKDVAKKFCRNGLYSIARLMEANLIKASTTITTDNFIQYISDKVKTSTATLPAPPLRKKPSPTGNGEKEFKAALTSVTSIPDWYKTDGISLGAPYPHQTYCWITHARSLDRALRRCPAGMSKGDVARDALGLVEDVANVHHRVQFKFNLNFDPKRHAVARPHALAGNRRFAACLPAPTEATRYYDLKWGATADLKQLAAGMTDVAGLPERISAPIPFGEIGPSLTIDYLGPVTIPRDTSPHGNRQYAKLLLAGISDADAVNQLASLFKL